MRRSDRMSLIHHLSPCRIETECRATAGQLQRTCQLVSSLSSTPTWVSFGIVVAVRRKRHELSSNDFGSVVGRLAPADRTVSWGSCLGIAPGRSLEDRPCQPAGDHIVPEGAGRLDCNRLEGVTDDHHFADTVGPGLVGLHLAVHQPGSVELRRAVARPLACAHSPPPFCEPSTPFGFP